MLKKEEISVVLSDNHVNEVVGGTRFSRLISHLSSLFNKVSKNRQLHSLESPQQEIPGHLGQREEIRQSQADPTLEVIKPKWVSGQIWVMAQSPHEEEQPDLSIVDRSDTSFSAGEAEGQYSSEMHSADPSDIINAEWQLAMGMSASEF